nr:recombinase family protein [Clostridium ganghwense]
MCEPNAEEYAAIYARRSTKIENNSIPSQIAIAKERIESEKLFIYDIYEDKESATKFHPLHRPGFKRLMYDAMNGKFKTIVVFRRDRLARRVEDLIEIKNTFKKHGIKIIYSNKGEYECDGSYLSSFIENIIIAVDELEPAILSERIAAGKKEKRERGEYVCGGCPPFGYKREHDVNGKSSYVHDKDKSKNATDNKPYLIREIFKKYLELDNDKNIFNNLTKEINKISDTKKFTKESIVNIIQRPVYAGLLLLDENTNVLDAVIEDPLSHKLTVDKTLFKKCTNVTKIIERETWYKALIKCKLNPAKRKTIKKDSKNYLFKTLLHCSKCKKPLHLSGKRYRCSNGCTSIPEYILIDTLFNQILNDLFTNTNIIKYQNEKLKEHEKQIIKSESEIKASSDRQNKLLLEIIENYSTENKDILNNADLNELISKEKTERAKIETLKQESTQLKITLEKLTQISNLKNRTLIINMFKRNIESTQQLLITIIKEVSIYKNEQPFIEYQR